MSYKKILLVMVALVIFLSLPAFAQMPRIINYQGKLTDASGVALDGATDITFRILKNDDPTTDSPGDTLWTEAHTGADAITVTNGLFDVQLGTITDLTIAFDDTYWIELEVEDETLSPREPLVSTPYAFRSIYSDTAVYADSAVYADTAYIISSGAIQTDGVSITGDGTESDPLSATLGNSIETGEITDGTIIESDLNAVNDPTDSYVLTYDSGTFGFLWVEPSGLGTGQWEDNGTATYARIIGNDSIRAYKSSDAEYGLRVVNTSSTDGAIAGEFFATNTIGEVTAVYGKTSSNNAYAYGVFGEGPYTGVYGTTNSSTDDSRAIYGEASRMGCRNYGVMGYAATEYDDGAGIFGFNSPLSGKTYGVKGENIATSDSSAGVYGTTSSGLTYAVKGDNFSSTTGATAGFFRNSASTGETYGIYSISKSTDNYARGIKSESPSCAIEGEVIDISGVNCYGQLGKYTGNAYGGEVYANSSSIGQCFGLKAQAMNATVANYAVWAVAGGSSGGGSTTYGVYGEGLDPYGVTGTYYGVLGRADASLAAAGQTLYGVYGFSQAGGDGTAYGVYGRATGAAINWAGYFDGDVYIGGKLTVVGGIDPTYLSFTPQASNPGLPTPGLWVDDSSPNVLYFWNGSTDVQISGASSQWEDDGTGTYARIIGNDNVRAYKSPSESYGLYASSSNVGIYGSGTMCGVQGSGYYGLYGYSTTYSGYFDGGCIKLPVKTTTGDPAGTWSAGAFYFNSADNSLRLYDGSAWTDIGGNQNIFAKISDGVNVYNVASTDDSIKFVGVSGISIDVNSSNGIVTIDGAGVVGDGNWVDEPTINRIYNANSATVAERVYIYDNGEMVISDGDLILRGGTTRTIWGDAGYGDYEHYNEAFGGDNGYIGFKFTPDVNMTVTQARALWSGDWYLMDASFTVLAGPITFTLDGIWQTQTLSVPVNLTAGNDYWLRMCWDPPYPYPYNDVPPDWEDGNIADANTSVLYGGGAGNCATSTLGPFDPWFAVVDVVYELADGGTDGHIATANAIHTGSSETITNYNHFGSSGTPSYANDDASDVYIDDELEVNGNVYTNANIQIPPGNAFYFGEMNTDGSWRIIREGENLTFQRRETGVWTTKWTITP